jgi:hypothetical protein
VQMCADLFPFRKAGNLLYLVCEKSILFYTRRQK